MSFGVAGGLGNDGSFQSFQQGHQHTTALEHWLIANGFGDIFVDQENIAGRRQEARRASAGGQFVPRGDLPH
jgi:hypothetical protein